MNANFITTRESSRKPRGSSRLTEGVSQMRVNVQATKIFKVAVVSLLLIFAVTAAQAQWPKPTTPPTPATIPAIQTVPIGFDETGFIEYASADALCDPVPPSAPLDTTAGVSSAAPTPT